MLLTSPVLAVDHAVQWRWDPRHGGKKLRGDRIRSQIWSAVPDDGRRQEQVIQDARQVLNPRRETSTVTPEPLMPAVPATLSFDWCCRLYIGLAGLATDQATFHDKLKFRLAMYSLREVRSLRIALIQRAELCLQGLAS